ncbi:hypothetical protein QYF36_003870 [Acer negundo]|nr:hypothetical protein QYF36_003870 [Acer negundo]
MRRKKGRELLKMRWMTGEREREREKAELQIPTGEQPLKFSHSRSQFSRLTIGAEVDEERIQLLLSEIKGKDLTELIASGREKLASVPSGGGGAVAFAATGAAAGGGAAPAAAEAKKEEKVEEKEESDDDMGFSLFD